MRNSLSEEEKFVIESLKASLGGSWRPGEDPPDAYLALCDTEAAVEISTLTQHVTTETGAVEPRLSQDAGVLRLCEELNQEIGNSIPAGSHVILTLYAPISKLRKFKSKIRDKVTATVRNGAFGEASFDIDGNEVELNFNKGDRPSGKKGIGIVGNKNSDPHISGNARFILWERIQEKAAKCSKVSHRPLWLALFNDYWLADTATYKDVFQPGAGAYRYQRRGLGP